MGTTRELLSGMALGHVGSSASIADLATEQSTEAGQCRKFIGPAILTVLEGFDWPEATGYATLALVAEEPNYDWDFSYRYPAEAVKIRRIVTALGRRDPNPPPFRVGLDAQGRLVYTNEAEAIVEYTADISSRLSIFPATLTDAVSWKLAEYIAPELSRVKGIMATVQGGYMMALERARVKAAQEQQQEQEPEADHIRARD